MNGQHCEPACPAFETTFCPACGRANKARLQGVRLMGFVGVLHSTSPKIEEFWQRGDPEIFKTP
jgi:hypothetical protein